MPATPHRENSYSPEAEIARLTALEAGKLIRERFHDTYKISQKSSPVDLVTEVDLAAEALIKQRLAEHLPDDAFYGEEGGGKDYRKGRVWVVDPLDGTTNFAHRLGLCCVSIAFFHEGIVRAGAVYQPMTNELYVACHGQGATLNGKPIHVSTRSSLQQSLGVTGFPYRIDTCLDSLLEQLRRIMPKVQGLRRLGSAAMDLCYLADGRFDFYWEMLLNPWDVAAGALILTEAGGKITGFDGGDRYIEQQRLLATNGLLHEPLLELLANTPPTSF